jgi:hypothetical protein
MAFFLGMFAIVQTEGGGWEWEDMLFPAINFVI